jgi:cyclopropane fatty-acyl-phospholipid synthase-like methyltransferase
LDDPKNVSQQTLEEDRHKLVGPPRLWKMKRDFQLSFLRSVGLIPQNYLLDIGCGTLRGGIPIINYLNKEHYFGIESRDFVLEEGRRELREHELEEKLPVLIHSPELSTVQLKQAFDYIWAFSVLIHMTDEIAHKCFRMISQHLNLSGAFYANVNVDEKPDQVWQEFPVVYRPMKFYAEIAEPFGMKVLDLGDLSSLGHVSNSASDEQRMLRFSF